MEMAKLIEFERKNLIYSFYCRITQQKVKVQTTEIKQSIKTKKKENL